MQNITYPAKVKQYLVNALKGIGLQKPEPRTGLPVEMSLAEIAKLLDDPQTTPDRIYNQIKLAVVKQLQTDARTNKFLQSDTAFDRKTIKSILTKSKIGNFQFADKICDLYLHNLTAGGIDQNGGITGLDQVGTTVERVVALVMAGLDEQPLNSKDKSNALHFWDEVLYAGYRDWLINDTKTYQPQLPYDQQTPDLAAYRQDQLANKLLKQTTARCNGNVQLAQSILKYKIQYPDDLQHLAANEKLFERSRKFCQASGRNPNNDLTVADVLAVLSEESTKTQVVTFFQTRSQEQKNDQKQNPKDTEVSRGNKIGNILGKNGRETTQKTTGKALAVDYDEFKMKKGSSGPWRGYKPLYDRIMAFLKDLYSNVMAISYTMNIMERMGVTVAQDNNETIRTPENPEKAWQTDYREVPQELQQTNPNQSQKQNNTNLNVAGEFYNLTKARILADKMRVAYLNAQMADDYMQTSPRLTEMQEDSAYLQQRIATAEKILTEEMPAANMPQFQDAQYFQKLEDRIINAQAVQNQPGVQQFLDMTQNFSANDEMIDALRTFQETAKGNTPNQKNASREMAVEMFHLQTQVGTEQIGDNDLDGMTARFVKSGMVDKLCNELTQVTPDAQKKLKNDPDIRLDSQDYVLTAVDTNASIHQFVEKDLQQHAAKDVYDQYMAKQSRAKILEEVAMEK